MTARQTQTSRNFSDLMSNSVEREENEVMTWAEIAQASRGRALHFTAGCEDHRFCRLPFNLVTKDRLGRPQIEFCNSKSLGPSSAVLICRQSLEPFQDIQLQLDDELDRPWVRAKVTDSRQTVGGYAVRVEFLTEARQAA